MIKPEDLKKYYDYEYSEDWLHRIEHLQHKKSESCYFVRNAYYKKYSQSADAASNIIFSSKSNILEYYYLCGISSTHGWAMKIISGFENVMYFLLEIEEYYKENPDELLQWPNIKPILDKYKIDTKIIQDNKIRWNG